MVIKILLSSQSISLSNIAVYKQQQQQQQYFRPNSPSNFCQQSPRIHGPLP